VYQPSSGALYPALERLERRGLLLSEALLPVGGGRLRLVYRLTGDGRQAHLGWVRAPVVPQTVSQDLGMGQSMASPPSTGAVVPVMNPLSSPA
jgi:DNA-binding PadR family transcriptional regulator